MNNCILNFFKNVKLIHVVIMSVFLGVAIPSSIFAYWLISIEQTKKIEELKLFGQNTAQTLSIAMRGHIWDMRNDLASELINSMGKDTRISEIILLESSLNSVFAKTKTKINPHETIYSFKKDVIHNYKKIGEVIVKISDYSTQMEIYQIKEQLLSVIIFEFSVIICLIVMQLYYRIIKPLKKLNLQAKYFYKNQLDISFQWSRNDEIGIVGKNFENARAQLFELQKLSKEYEKRLITEVDQKTKELTELNENLENKINVEIEKNKKQTIILQQQGRLAALGEMMENIAHQWRQPLSAITSHASALLLKDELKILDEDDVKNTSNGILKSAKFLSKTIDDFRDFLNKDKTKKDFNIARVIYEIYHIIEASFRTKNINIAFNLDETLSYNGYPNELSQVILNILNNAKDILIQNEIKNKLIQVSLTKKENHFSITIIDNGGGVPENIISKIFDPYFTTKHKTQGTGIGLYMSSKIIKEQFDGDLFVTNEEISYKEEKYVGAKFHIILPPFE